MFLSSTRLSDAKRKKEKKKEKRKFRVLHKKRKEILNVTTFMLSALLISVKETLYRRIDRV